MFISAVKVEHFDMGGYGDSISFRTNLKWPFMELQLHFSALAAAA